MILLKLAIFKTPFNLPPYHECNVVARRNYNRDEDFWISALLIVEQSSGSGQGRRASIVSSLSGF
jgi:hypothetical protein